MKRDSFNKICKDIKSIKIQGASNVAKAGLRAYNLNPTKQTKSKILSLRSTEPMLKHVLDLAEKYPERLILRHFSLAQEKINKEVLGVIKNGDIIFTHCHSTNVVKSLIYAKEHKRKFQVYNTETRPLFQGRKTAKELSNKKIKVTTFIDSAMNIALEGKQGIKKTTKVFIGADALTKNGIINKIGSGMLAELSYKHRIPVYIIADSWKFSKDFIPIEQRKLNEVWDKAPKNIKIKNPAFEFVHSKYITKIITEYGNLSYNQFIKKINNKNI